MSFSWPPDSRDVDDLRVLTDSGGLATAYAEATPERRIELRRSVHLVACRVVFQKLTVGLENRRQHRDCVRGLPFLRPDCLDRFHEAVEAVVDHTLHRATVPIRQLEPWMASRVSVATVDRHRMRRGERGAQQKPSVPRWLEVALDEDPWLVELALKILTWVGIPDVAGPGIWPVDAWADRRAAVTGQRTAGDAAAVRRDIDQVLDTMHAGRPNWYAKYVLRPLNHKPVPVAPAIGDQDSGYLDPPALALVAAHESRDAAMLELAASCLDAIIAGLAVPGRQPRTVVLDAVRTTFGADRLDPGQVPFADHNDAYADVDELLSDPKAVDRMVDLLLAIIADLPDDPTPGAAAPAATDR